MAAQSGSAALDQLVIQSTTPSNEEYVAPAVVATVIGKDGTFI